MSNLQQMQGKIEINPKIFSQDHMIIIQKSVFALVQVIEAMTLENQELKAMLLKSPNIVDQKFKEYNANLPVKQG